MTFEPEKNDWSHFPFVLLSANETGTSARTPVISRSNYGEFTVEYVASGAGFLNIDGRSFHVERDSVYFLTHGSTHSYWPDRRDPWYKLFFVLSGGLDDELLRAYRLDRVYCIPDCPELKKYFGEMFAVNRNSAESNRQAAVIFHEFLADAARLVYRNEDEAPAEAGALKRKLDDAFENRFTLEAYAAEHDCSESALIRSFRAAFGATPHEYLMRRKFEEARRLLLYSGLSMKEIAASLAFADQYHFSNAFKRRSGLSPLAFRKKYTS